VESNAHQESQGTRKKTSTEFPYKNIIFKWYPFKQHFAKDAALDEATYSRFDAMLECE
jgi:hypothetical protein